MTSADPFARIPDPDSGYEGTVLETTVERAARDVSSPSVSGTEEGN